MALPVVTPENYYSPEMNMAYMGSTQFKAFERCEAAALAELKGEYRPPSSAALLVGGYIDAWFSGELPLYQAQHPEIFKRDGTLKAEYAEDGKIPSFAAAVARKNMLERKVGFVCQSTAGRVVKLLQNYDSTVYPQEPEDLPAQWGFHWSTDPKKALPFIAMSTSPYAKDDCCTHDGHVWRSGQDNNVWAPGTAGAKWDDLGEIEEVMEAG